MSFSGWLVQGVTIDKPPLPKAVAGGVPLPDHVQQIQENNTLKRRRYMQ